MNPASESTLDLDKAVFILKAFDLLLVNEFELEVTIA